MRALILALLLAIALPAWSIPAFVVSATCGGTNGCTTSGANTTGATLIVASVTNFSASAPTTPTDSKGNTWTPLTDRVSGTTLHNRLFYTVPTSVGSGHTFTDTDTGDFPGMTVLAFSGTAASSPFDVQNGGTTTSGTTLASGSITPSLNNDSSFATPIGINEGTTGGNEGNYMSYLIQNPAAAVNPTWTCTAPRAASIASFKPFVPGNCAACDMSGF